MAISNNLRKYIPLQLILFIFFFGCLTCFINSKNTVAFGLQQRGIESIVERGNIYLDTPSDRMEYYTSNFTWDTFSYKNHAYLAKQPGQFFLGSIIYFFLYKLGITYKSNYMLACGLIALFTSSLMLSSMMLMIFNIFLKIIKKRMLAFIATCFFGFGTLMLPYSGILQHDICATFFLFSSFYLLFYKYHLKSKSATLITSIAGFLCGFSSFFSNNTITIMFVLFLYVLCKKNWKDILIFAFSFLIGLLPIFVFNYCVFGHPLNFSINLYAKFFNQSHEITLLEYLPSILKRIDLYLISPITAITFYSPIYLLSYCGLLFLPKKYSIEKVILLPVFILQFFQPSLYGVAGYGWCQYGPRYLIESMPFTLIGLSGFFVKEKGHFRALINKYKYLFSVIWITGIISIVICSVGSIGIIYCGYYANAFLSYIARIISGENLPNYYLITPGIIIIFISLISLFMKYPKAFKTTLNKLKTMHQEHGIKWLYLTTIILLGLYLRATRLDELPIGLSADEASIGYNAFSISKTGFDEDGKTLPVFFNGSTGTKSPLIVYLSALLVKLLSPSIFSLRLTSSLLGVITIFFTYKLTSLYFSSSTALLASFLLSISPWHIQFSRFSNELISFPCFFILGLYLFALGLKKKDSYIIWSSIPISLAFYSYEMAIIFIPIFFSCFIVLNIKTLLKKQQAVITSLFIMSAILSPLLKKAFEDCRANRVNLKLIRSQVYLKSSLKEYFTNYNNSRMNTPDYNAYAIAKATENLKEYKIIVLPFDFSPEIFLYLHKIDPKQWIADKSVLRFITNGQYETQKQNYAMKKLARIAIPGSYQDEETVGYVYKEQTNEIIYEIKKIKPLSLIDKKTFSPQSIGGLKGEYFNGRNFNSLKMIRIDRTIDFNWEWNSPDPAINNDNFSVRWVGWINIIKSGNYKFITNNDDGVQLSIDGSTIIDDWKSHPLQVNETSINLDTGWHQIEVKFFEDTGGNSLSLSWLKPGGSKEIIPSNVLSPDSIYKQ